MFRTAVVALFAAAVSAMDTSASIPLTSKAGQELLVKATVIEESRALGGNNYDYSWMANYAVRYNGCSDLVQANPSQNGNNNKNNNNNNNQNSFYFTQHLVRFSICPVNDCSSTCSGGGSYVVNMADFVDLYTEFKMTALEQQCETVREACYCDDATDDQVCENQCYTSANLTSCINYQGDQDFEIQRYLECAELKDQGNNKNENNYNYDGDYYYGEYYAGPYCPDGKNIYMGLFYDQACTSAANISQYALRMGSDLPFATKSIVTPGDCLACQVANNNNNNNNNNNGANVAQVCYTTHASAARCEDGMSITYPDTSACDYIKTVLPRLDAASRSIYSSNASTAKSGKAAKAFAFIFAFTTVLFAAYAYFLYRKIKRGVVALAAQG